MRVVARPDPTRFVRGDGSGGFQSIGGFKLRPSVSVYRGELLGILLALLEDLPTGITTRWVFSDSLSAVQSIQGWRDTRCSLVETIIGRIVHLKDCVNCDVKIRWCPGHCSIPGNEAADLLAKRSALEGNDYALEEDCGTFIRNVKLFTNDKWQREWSSAGTG